MDRNEPILSETDISIISKLIMGHHIVACEEFYVHNNIVIYLERTKPVPKPDFLQYVCYITRRHTKIKCIDVDRTLKMQPFVISSGDKISKLL